MLEGYVDHCDPLRVIGWAFDTERQRRQHDYLNPPTVNCRYLAVWIAIDDIPADCRPVRARSESP